MKIQSSSSKAEQGNLILVSLIIGAVAGLVLASYLLLTQQQNVSIYRSQTWNGSMVLSEAGIEDGLQLVNYYAGSFQPKDLYKWTNTAIWSGAGWDHPAAGIYHVKRYITNAVAGVNWYEAWISTDFSNNTPTIRAVGTVPWTYALNSGSGPVFADLHETRPASSIARTVSVKTRNDPLFVVAMAATDTINLKGSGVYSDSFDSADPNYSINGHYPTNNPSMTKDNGDICTDSILMDSLYLGNAHVRGKVRTGPGTNTIQLNNGSVGDANWVATKKGVQDGWSSTDFNVIFPEVILPGALWLPIGPHNYTDTNGVDYTYHLTTGGFYKLNSMTGSMLVEAPPNDVVTVWLDCSVDLYGGEVIRIKNTGASLVLYVTGPSFSVGGNAWIDNQSGMANDFYLYGLKTLTTLSLAGNGSFYGGIYAPQATFLLGGGGHDNIDFIGGSVTRSVTMNGHFNFHYDENLARVGPSRGYIPVAWQEL